MKLSDLHNPDNTRAILVYRTNELIHAADDQGFHVTPGKVELWEEFNGGLHRIRAWRKTSVCQYT